MHLLGPETGRHHRQRALRDRDELLALRHAGHAHREGLAEVPVFYTVLALTDLDDPRADDELRHVAAECGRKLKRLKPGTDPLTDRRIAIIERVLAKA